MSHAEVCPVCGGTGKKYPNQLWGTTVYMETCNGCGGIGWIVVPDTLPQKQAISCQPAEKRGEEEK